MVLYMSRKMNTAFIHMKTEKSSAMGQVAIWQRCGLSYGVAGLRC